MSTVFLIFEQQTPLPPKGCRYRLAECIVTSDGMRTRLTNFCSDSLEATSHEARVREEKANEQ